MTGSDSVNLWSDQSRQKIVFFGLKIKKRSKSGGGRQMGLIYSISNSTYSNLASTPFKYTCSKN